MILEILQWILILVLLVSRARIQFLCEHLERRLDNVEGSIKDGILDMLRREP